ncbi:MULTISPECIES: mechanosensitive ion channel domain-containing protein [unclassified Paraburkholderia]|uniref:mechanosensitive ion channel domain-containing protein n=1 Tax=unclassified Paraburkholderia TaxID=2615204 RepID=UPI001617D89F|nr:MULTISPECIES: mechanosensitive ion channel domain-containing protein [unclassified Paraburkholderia]MBB5446585.1 small-conductance mechanosensitive channel [Paraburkholderia sp. WSM4177]MBB5487131.1 small-conductance mechanosensitive channel [Paraburkholderia sp. WSM4180]
MQKFLRVCFFIFLLAGAAPVFAAAPAPAHPTPATPASAAVTLTPQQARDALAVLNDPKRRAQVADTLQAIAAAGALSAPPASAPAAAAAPAAASGAAALVPDAFKSNGLASQLAREGAHYAGHLATALRGSIAALLDVASVRAWWNWQFANPHARAVLFKVLWSLLAALIPALVLEWLARRLLRRVFRAIAARREAARQDDNDNSSPPARDAGAAPAGHPPTSTPPLPPLSSVPSVLEAEAQAVATGPAAPYATPSAKGRAIEAEGKRNATHHWTLLQRLPRALLITLVRLVPIAVFVGAASALMSIFTGNGTPQDRALDSLIDVYVVCRCVVIVGAFFLQPSAPRLRLLRMGDAWAAFVLGWIVRIVSVVGAGVALAEVAQALGMNYAAHLALLKVVALAGHVMISILVLRCAKPVANRIRNRFAAHESLEMFGNAFADAWAVVTVVIVMGLWFVWAFDVRNGYHALVNIGGMTLAILIGARLVSIVIFGALARIFHVQDEASRSLVHEHAYRYYPALRRVIGWIIGSVTALVLLQAWGVDVIDLFRSGTIGHRLASALATIAVAAIIALVVWEVVNVSAERRLDNWTSNGDLVRAARLRTLMPMLRTALFCVIALVVVLTGLSQLGVNIGPLLAGASIFGVALGFGSQKLVQDFITGIFLLMENAMQVGDWVTLAGVSGTVEYLSIRTVRLRGGDGSLFTVPFSSVSTVNNTNRGIGNAAVRVNIVFGQDVERAIDTLKEIGASLRTDDNFKDGILADFSFWGVDAVDGSAITLAGQMQCRDTSRWGVQREFNRRILERFSELGIEIANPQRHLLTWDPASKARFDTALPRERHGDRPDGDAAGDGHAPHKGDAPLDDQIPVDPSPAGGPGTPGNPGSTSPHA